MVCRLLRWRGDAAQGERYSVLQYGCTGVGPHWRLNSKMPEPKVDRPKSKVWQPDSMPSRIAAQYRALVAYKGRASAVAPDHGSVIEPRKFIASPAATTRPPLPTRISESRSRSLLTSSLKNRRPCGGDPRSRWFSV